MAASPAKRLYSRELGVDHALGHGGESGEETVLDERLVRQLHQAADVGDVFLGDGLRQCVAQRLLQVLRSEAEMHQQSTSLSTIALPRSQDLQLDSKKTPICMPFFANEAKMPQEVFNDSSRRRRVLSVTHLDAELAELVFVAVVDSSIQRISSRR